MRGTRRPNVTDTKSDGGVDGTLISPRALKREEMGWDGGGLSAASSMVRRAVEADHRRLPAPGAPASCRGHLHARALLRTRLHHLDRTYRPRPADRRAACHRGSGVTPQLRRLGARHPARALDRAGAAEPP